MPRPRLLDRPIEKSVSIPASVLQPVEVLLLDSSGKIPQGAFAKLVTRLLRQWLKEQQEK